jgi:hypothetical protein
MLYIYYLHVSENISPNGPRSNENLENAERDLFRRGNSVKDFLRITINVKRKG